MKIKNFFSGINKTCVNLIFPREYPYSVKAGYKEFSTNNFIINVCFNVMNFITTQVLINSLNLNIGKATGYAFSAGLNWAIKEGVGQAGKNKIYLRGYLIRYKILQNDRTQCQSLESFQFNFLFD